MIYSSLKDTNELIVNKFAILEAEQMLLREAEQVLKQNLHNSKEYPSDHDIFDIPEAKSTPTKFIFPLDETQDFQNSYGSLDTTKPNESLNITSSFNGSRKSIGEQSDEDKKRLEQLKKEKKEIVAVISRIKRQMAEIEIQEEELHREVNSSI